MSASPRRWRFWTTLASAGAAYVAVVACEGEREGVPASRGTSSASARLESLLVAGDSAYRQVPESARGLWEAALTIARAERDSGAIARALTGLGMAARMRGDFATSRRLGEEGLALKLRLGMRRELFRSYNALGLLAWEEDRLRDAAQLLEQAKSAAEAVRDSLGVAKAAANHPLVLQGIGAFGAAHDAFGVARSAALRVADTATVAKVANNMAALDIVLGDPLSAVSGLDEARRLARAVGDSATELNARGQLAIAYAALGEPQRAFAILDSAVRMAERSGRRSEAAANRKIMGDLFAEAGDHRHALEQYQATQGLIDSLELPETYANALRNAARSLEALGNVPQARSLALHALAIHRRSDLRWHALGDIVFLIALEGRAGERAAAEAQLRAGALLAESLATPVAHARIALAEAHMAAAARDWPRVLTALDRITSAADHPTLGDEAEAARLRARALGALGRLDDAVLEGRRAIAVIERVRATYGSGELRTAYLAEKSSAYAEQALLLLRTSRLDEAFRVADAARGRALLEHIVAAREDIGDSTVSRPLLERERLLRRIDALVARLESRRQGAPRERSTAFEVVNTELADSLRAARTQYEALLARDDRRVGARAALVGTAQFDVDSLATSLGHDEVLLEYLVTPDRLLIFIITTRGLSIVAHDVSSETLAARVRLARQLLQDPARAATAAPTLRALYTDLISPVAATGSLRSARRLVIVPHAFLTYLPFSALLAPRAHRYLAEDFVLTHAATAMSIVASRSRGRGTPIDDEVRPGVIAFAPFPDALPASGHEATTIAALAGGTQALLGDRATEREVRTALASRSTVHLATHARMNPGNPLFSRIELAGSSAASRSDNARLEVHELLGMRVSSPLVFLSGCETALGASWSTRFDTGEDYTTLSQVLLYAGARAVVATLWRVDDRGSAELARRFYGSRRSGAAEALAMAQRAMLADPAYQSPYYWAAHQVSGGGS